MKYPICGGKFFKESIDIKLVIYFCRRSVTAIFTEYPDASDRIQKRQV